MAYLLWFLPVLVTLARPTLAQSTYPTLPDRDYAVYSAVGDYFSQCDDPKLAYRRNESWLVSALTEPYPSHGFGFKFDETPKQLAWRFQEKDPFYKKPDWWSFLASIDGSEFTQHELKKLPDFACRLTFGWTNAQMKDYFDGGNWQARGYKALNKEYPKFGAMITFSKTAFSADDTKAVCYFSEQSGSLSGGGYLVFLEKKAGKWGVIDATMLWIS